MQKAAREGRPSEGGKGTMERVPVIGGGYTETAEVKVAAQEGGNYLTLRIHALVMPDGSRWDARNGWTSGPACDSGWAAGAAPD